MSSQNQPRWAWWVVGILIPLLGIGVSVWLATKSDSDDKADASSTAPAATSGGTSGESTGSTGNAGGSSGGASAPSTDRNAPAKVLYGPSDLTVTGDDSHVVLDTEAPMGQSSEDGSDLSVLFNVPPPMLVTTDSAKTMAVLPAQGTEPTAADCAEAIAKRGTDSVSDLKAGMRLCVRTDEGHTAYVQVTRASLKAMTFRITAWD